MKMNRIVPITFSKSGSKIHRARYIEQARLLWMPEKSWKRLTDIKWVDFFPLSVMPTSTASHFLLNASSSSWVSQPMICLIRSAWNFRKWSNSCRLSQNKHQETASIAFCRLQNGDMSNGPLIVSIPLSTKSLTYSFSNVHVPLAILSEGKAKFHVVFITTRFDSSVLKFRDFPASPSSKALLWYIIILTILASVSFFFWNCRFRIIGASCRRLCWFAPPIRARHGCEETVRVSGPSFLSRRHKFKK